MTIEQRVGRPRGNTLNATMVRLVSYYAAAVLFVLAVGCATTGPSPRVRALLNQLDARLGAARIEGHKTPSRSTTSTLTRSESALRVKV